jgi:hypothetical protein
MCQVKLEKCWLVFVSDTFVFLLYFCFCGTVAWLMASSFLRFLDHTHRRITIGRTSLDE